MRISLDSNVFRDQDFIDWLQSRRDHLDVFISVISALETYHWYNIRGLSKDLFEKDLQELNAQVLELSLEDIYKISASAQTTNLPFKHHARDFIIGTHAIDSQSVLITYNLKHFGWLKPGNLLSPDLLVLTIENTIS